ncbi:MAG: ArsB/NhaD family transporter [Candidatus Gracilibacteria bacterium]|nr:ArsB/NhaD family transporter [Candidatus Gracilibacteria bacterium]
MLTYITLGIFLVALGLIVFEVFDKSLVALGGAILMVVIGILTPEEAIESIEFETILLLLAMMLLVNIASKSGIFSWLNVKIASFTKGNPLIIFLLFSLITAVFSAFLDNVTTVILIVPLTIELVKGMGRDPKPYVFAEIIFSNVGGALTLIGDPPNIMIGGATGLNFLQFVQNLWIPISLVIIFTMIVFILVSWKSLKPIADDLIELTIANITIRKIQYEFLKVVLHKDFVIKVITILVLTLMGFLFQSQIGLPTYVIAFGAAIVLALMCEKKIDIHDAFRSIEWPTLLFFSGLFVMVGGLESTGLLENLSHMLVNSTSSLLFLALIILWASGLISMILDNIPFVAVMIPVIMGMQSQLTGDASILWWALSLGACLGGNGTLIGASANVVSADIANKRGVRITFLDFMKFSLPITLGMLVVCSLYLTVKIIYF